MSIVTLLSDFGTRDSYVSQMKGVILTINPSCQIVDISHDVGRHDVLMGAFLLESCVSHFPKNTVHVAVVDPEVGSKRLPLIVACRESTLVGPDNGVLSRAARRLGIEAVYKIQHSGSNWRSVSHTFHGRDVFAVVAAKLSRGALPREFGPKVRALTELGLLMAKVNEGLLSCYVLHIDTFGNIITNAENTQLGRMKVRRGERVVVTCKTGRFQGRVARAYYEVERGELAVIEGSQGYIEFALREDDAASLLHAAPKDELVITRMRLSCRSLISQ